jgi:hypothetical protein
MDHPEPPIDSRRLDRWTAHPREPSRPRRPLASPHTVISAHGGEVAFWLAWLCGDLDPGLQAWFRRRAEQDPVLRNDLHSIEQPDGSGYTTAAARAEVRDALEAGHYLVPAPGSGLALSLGFSESEEQTETNLILSRQGPANPQAPPPEAELRRRVRLGLFVLLQEVDILVPPAEEAVEGTRLVEHLVGAAAVNKFLRLQQLQALPPEPRPTVRRRLLVELAPQLFAREGDRLCHHLSFRLFLRARLQHYCRQRGWLPLGSKYADLVAAFAALSRERMGIIVRGLLETPQTLEAGVPREQVADLLATTP